MIEHCCFCKHLTLQITGLDAAFDAAQLCRSEPDDLRLQAEQAHGHAHLSCLAKSPWRHHWARRQLEHLVWVRGFELLQNRDDAVLLRLPRTGEVALSWQTGVFVSIPQRHLVAGFRAEQSIIQYNDRGRWWKLPLRANPHELAQFFNDVGYLPFAKLADLFGVPSQFYDKAQAQKIRLYKNKDSLPYLEDKHEPMLMGDVTCPLPVPRTLVPLLNDIVKQVVQ